MSLFNRGTGQTPPTYPELIDARPASIPDEVWDEASAAAEEFARDATYEQIENCVRLIASAHITASQYHGVPLPERPPAPPSHSDLGRSRDRYGFPADNFDGHDPYSRHMREVAERRDKVERLTSEIMADRVRRATVFLHFATTQEARRIIAAQKEAADRETAFLFQYQCPICLDTDPAHVGLVTNRTLLTSLSGGAFGGVLRSCEVCWRVASDHLIARLAQESLGDGSQTRSEAVVAHLASHAMG